METNAQDVQQGADDTAKADGVETEVETTGTERSDPPADGNAAEKKEDNPFSKRVDELTKLWRKEQRERAQERMASESLRREVEHLRTQRQAPVETQATKTLADFEYDEAKYQQYLFSEAGSRAVKSAQEELKKAEETRTRETRVKSFLDRESKYAEKFDDYYEVTRDNSLPLTEAIVEAVQETENAPELLYHLGKNPDIAHQLARLSPTAAARELGRIEAKLEYEREKAAAATAAAKVSKAPEPAAKVDSASARSEKREEDMDDNEWGKQRQKQREKAAKGSFDGRIRASGR